MKDSAYLKKLAIPALAAALLLAPQFAQEPVAKETRPGISKRSGESYYYYSAAQMLRKSGNIKGAIELYAKAVSLDPESAVLYADLGLLHLGAGDIASAKTASR